LSKRIIDVSHTIEQGLITYKGLPAPLICDFLSHEASHGHYGEGTEFCIGKIEMVANTGTYIDSPYHRYRDGIDIAELPLNSTTNLDSIVIRQTKRESRAIDVDLFRNTGLKNKAVLIHTGWDEHWKADAYFENYPFLTRDAAEYLRDSGAILVGIDSFNIDDTNDGERPVHTILLESGIPIVEHLTGLENLPDKGFRFFAAPVKVKGMGSFPIRAIAIVDD
jgi:kynurenine formamidase